MNKLLCENCEWCEMYNNDDALCSLKEKWVENNSATYCDFFVRDGGSNE